MVAMIFFSSGRQHLANHPTPPVRLCPLLPDPPHLPNVRTSFMDGPFYESLDSVMIFIWSRRFISCILKISSPICSLTLVLSLK